VFGSVTSAGALAVAASESVTPENRPGPQTLETDAFEGELRNMSWIGFQQFQDASRIFVRTTEPAKYRVEKISEQTILLTLENTHVPLSNNVRILDTRYFDSPIAKVVPSITEAPSPIVQIEIWLRRPATFTHSRDDNAITLDFRR